MIWNGCWYPSQIPFSIKSTAIIYQVSLYGTSFKYVLHVESYIHILKWTAHLMSSPGGYCRFWLKIRLLRPELPCQNGILFTCSVYIIIQLPTFTKAEKCHIKDLYLCKFIDCFFIYTLWCKWSTFGRIPDLKEWVLLWTHKLKPKDFCLYWSKTALCILDT